MGRWEWGNEGGKVGGRSLRLGSGGWGGGSSLRMGSWRLRVRRWG